jgi:hypothetical protein
MPGKENLKNTPINRPYYSASLQVSPGAEYRPTNGEPPDPAQWYHQGTYQYLCIHILICYICILIFKFIYISLYYI